MAKTRKKIIFFSLLGVLLLLPLMAGASSLKTRNNIVIPAEETVNDNVYALGKNISVEGKIIGDLIALGQNLTIKGEIEGDVIGLASNINLEGKVSGSVKLAGENINFEGAVSENAYLAGANVFQKEGSKVGRDLLLASPEAELRGEVGRNLKMAGSKLVLKGLVNGRADLLLDKREIDSPLTITESAQIKDGLYYRAGVKGDISEKAGLGGELKHEFYPVAETNISSWVWNYLLAVFASLLIGLIFVTLFKNKTLELFYHFKESTYTTFLKGLALLVLPPLAGILLLFTLIGAPLTIIIISLWLVALIVSRVLVAIYLGRLITKKANYKKDSLMVALIVGVVIAWVAFSLPLVGWIFSLVATLWGLGAMFNYLKSV